MPTDKLLRSVRPKLKLVAPLTNAICWVYAIANILIGMGMYLFYETRIPLVVANIFTYQQWGILFGITGLLSLYALSKNEWHMTRKLLVIGLGLKAIWGIALVIRCISSPPTILITLVWLSFVCIQAATYIYFLPKQPNNG